MSYSRMHTCCFFPHNSAQGRQVSGSDSASGFRTAPAHHKSTKRRCLGDIESSGAWSGLATAANLEIGTWLLGVEVLIRVAKKVTYARLLGAARKIFREVFMSFRRSLWIDSDWPQHKQKRKALRMPRNIVRVVRGGFEDVRSRLQLQASSVHNES